jgi:hypothetical protein
MSYANAMNYIKVFRVHTRELAGQLGFDKAARLALAPEPVKMKLLKPQSDGLPLAAHLPKADINTRIVEAATKAREKANPDAEPRGRPAKSKFEFALEMRRKTAKVKKDIPVFIKLDDSISLEIVFNEKNESISVQFVKVED